MFTQYGKAEAPEHVFFAGCGTRLAREMGLMAASCRRSPPSSMTTCKGRLSMPMGRKAEGMLVSSAAVFEGQSSDWARSKRVPDELHQDILNYRSLQP